MNSFKNTTGLSQEEIATYLGVTRTQWSMFAIGKRGLPIKAILKLSALLEHLQKDESNRKKDSFIERDDKVAKDELKKKLLDLGVMLYQVNKKINEMIKNREQLFSAITTLEFLKSQKNNDVALITLIEKRIQKSTVSNSIKNLETLELKKQQIENLMNYIQKMLS